MTGWISFTLGAGAEVEIQGSISAGTSGTEVCEVVTQYLLNSLNQ